MERDEEDRRGRALPIQMTDLLREQPYGNTSGGFQPVRSGKPVLRITKARQGRWNHIQGHRMGGATERHGDPETGSLWRGDGRDTRKKETHKTRNPETTQARRNQGQADGWPTTSRRPPKKRRTIDDLNAMHMPCRALHCSKWRVTFHLSRTPVSPFSYTGFTFLVHRFHLSRTPVSPLF
jgi:hypothetical protein